MVGSVLFRGADLSFPRFETVLCLNSADRNGKQLVKLAEVLGAGRPIVQSFNLQNDSPKPNSGRILCHQPFHGPEQSENGHAVL